MTQPTDFLPLTGPVFQILLALSDEERHGYAILQEIERRSGGDVTISTGTLYTAIKRLLASELIASAESRPDRELDDERRRYYAITPLGERVLAAEAARMNALVGMAREKRVL